MSELLELLPVLAALVVLSKEARLWVATFRKPKA
jgi:hypothetical protein